MRDGPKDSLNYRTIFHKIKVEYHERDTQTKLRKNALEKEGGDCLDKRNVSRSRRQHAWRLFSLISQKCLQKKGKGNGLLGLKDKIQTFWIVSTQTFGFTTWLRGDWCRRPLCSRSRRKTSGHVTKQDFMIHQSSPQIRNCITMMMMIGWLMMMMRWLLSIFAKKLCFLGLKSLCWSPWNRA